MSSVLGIAHTYYTPELQHRIAVVLEIPIDQYDTQQEAMNHAYSTASRTKHRMLAYPVRNQASFIIGWRIKIGKGALSELRSDA